MTEIAKGKMEELRTKLCAIRAGDMMTKSVITATPQMTLTELADLMIQTRISGLPVMGKEGKAIGVVTTTDLLIVMGMILDETGTGESIPSLNPSVDFAMSSEVIAVREDATLEELVKLMRNKGIHTIPVMEGEKLLGVVGRHDILKQFYEIIKSL